MVKVGEKNCVSFEWIDRFLGGIKKFSDRARLIFVPHGEAACGLLTMMQRPLLKAIKKVMPSFCHSVSCTEMASDIQNNLKTLKWDLKDVVALCADGSNHDGHQHMDLIKAVDFSFFNTLFKHGWAHKTLSKYKYHGPSVHSVLKVPIYEEVAVLKSVFSGFKLRMKILGTTFSGSPTRTTLGNTLRVFSYWSYICKQAGLSYTFLKGDINKDVFIYVSGDDVVMWTHKNLADRIIASSDRLTSKDKSDKFYGLGQCIEKIAVTPWYDIDFCSKISFQYWVDNRPSFVILRDPRKVLTHSNFHRYCSDLAFMPAALHNEYVAESVEHEMPGELMKAYARNRRRLGKMGLRSRNHLVHYTEKIKEIRKSYNIDDKIIPNDVQMDELMARKLGLTFRNYVSLTI